MAANILRVLLRTKVTPSGVCPEALIYVYISVSIRENSYCYFLEIASRIEEITHLDLGGFGGRPNCLAVWGQPIHGEWSGRPPLFSAG